jgi:signal-transduction protein with cAMP-binding, CBS, and nucleotidyltransferase domain
MTPVVHSVTERASLQSITRMMMRKHIHRVIVRKGRKVAGIISALDILKSVLRPERAHAAARPTARGRRASRRAAARP